MALNLDDDLAYENLTIIIDEFEKAALQSGTREGAMVVANSPLTAMDQMLEKSANALGTVSVARGEANSGQTDEGTTIKKFLTGQGNNVKLLSYDSDIEELFGNEKNPVKNYIEECLGCDLRLQFDWQLKPINLLGGIEGLIKGVNEILDAFQIQLDPGKTLEGICGLLEKLKGLCIPDLITVLLSLKLLLKRYITDAINIRLDWTVVLGPLLKAIVEGIASLLENLAAVLLAPLDCALAALKTANELEHETRDLLGQVSTFAKHQSDVVGSVLSGTIPANVNLEGVEEAYSWGGSTVGEDTYPDAPQFGRLQVSQQKLGGSANYEFSGGAGVDTALRMPVGFQFNAQTTLDGALKDPSFVHSTITEKLLVPVQEARNYIRDLLSQILKSLRSVQALVSGGLSVQMGKIGIIIFLTDMINLVMMLITMLKQHRNVQDWCTHLEENPHIFEEGLKARFGRSLGDIKVEADKNERKLILKKGPTVIREIKTCATQRTTPESELLDQWIQDLKSKGT